MAVASVSTVCALAEAVANFGAMIHAMNPDSSFCIVPRTRKRDTAPPGMKMAITNGRLEQNRYAQTVDDGTAADQTNDIRSTDSSE